MHVRLEAMVHLNTFFYLLIYFQASVVWAQLDCPIQSPNGDYLIRLRGTPMFGVSGNGTCSCKGAGEFLGGIGLSNSSSTTVNGDLVVSGRIMNDALRYLNETAVSQQLLIDAQQRTIDQQQLAIQQLRLDLDRAAMQLSAAVNALDERCCRQPGNRTFAST
eukprot:TRINITY_DN8642_c0_g1_i1.p2 TRINITY_DN8642_c0_g1~~TRINITY_DN8642_c0_g1_i1.p2  ORF type:complete len:162 (-),score=24.23 TRINITY_DN8642_c0_g1_i1:363-848(-)